MPRLEDRGGPLPAEPAARSEHQPGTVVIAEPQFKGVTHASVNAALLRSTALAYPRSRRVFLSPGEHDRWVRRALAAASDAGSVSAWKSLPELPSQSHAGRLRRLLAELSVYRCIARGAGALRADLLLLCSVTRPGLLLMRLLAPRYLRHTKVLAVTHQLNELSREPLNGSRRLSSLRLLLGLPFPQQMRLLAPAAPILAELEEQFPRIARSFSSIELPYVWHAESATEPPERCRELVFGFFGVGRPERIGPFCRLARRVRRTFPEARFVLVGYLKQTTEELLSYRSAVEGLETRPLGIEELRRRASEVHFAVWTAPPDAYRMTLSASFLDALSHVKPCIFLENAFVSHYYRRMGDIGYPCGDLDEMYEVITALLRGASSERYRGQCERIIQGRRLFSVEAAAASLRREAPPS